LSDRTRPFARLIDGPNALPPTVVVLGAGINGAALARELVLHGLDVVLVDSGDIACGTTAYSSRLIHGGLRYLEYGDVELVRESLAERDRLLRLTPQFVRPLEFRVPTTSRGGGWIDSAVRYFGFARAGKTPARRGAWLVRTGLFWYDRLARHSKLPGSRLKRRDLDRDSSFASRYRFFCAYYDAQMPYPEQFTAALVVDAASAAGDSGRFRVHTYAQTVVDGDRLVVTPADGRGPSVTYTPAAVVNAGGPWGDRTLSGIGIASPRLIGGTKGSHIVTFRDDLRRALGDAAVYAEADDGRPVFILPFGDGTLIGTTDLPYDGDPADAVATPAEIGYLLGLANSIFPELRLSTDDVALHYAGVRPLPFADRTVPAAVTRRHAVTEQPGTPWPCYTLVGGKLTTCRQLAEDAAAVVLRRLGREPGPVSHDRKLPPECYATPPARGPNYPGDGADPATRAAARIEVLDVIRRTFVRRLEDLVERRLMLLFARRLTRRTLEELAQVMIEAGVLDPAAKAAEVERTVARLATHFGRKLDT
jgi:glycerol-3-phosphate dehydrogenase